jgi:hypothetical protein
MADTYGYNPDGSKKYDAGQYDQWNVFMGNRAPLVAPSNVGTGGFNQWTSNVPFEQWLPQYAKQQLARGRGSLGAEVTAAPGTPEYRQQVADRQQAAQWIIDRGGTVGDMGIRPAKGAGLNLWNQFADVKGGQYGDRFKQMARNYYDRAAAAGWQPHEGHAGGAAGAPSGFGGTGFGGGTPTGGGGSFTPGAPGAPAPAAGQASFGMPAPAGMTRQLPGLLGANAPGAPAPTDSYMQVPRGARPRGLRGLIGG